MPMHDWTSVPPGVFHAFHHAWIQSLSNDLNGGILPAEFYALPEQQAAGFGPDVLTLQTGSTSTDEPGGPGIEARTLGTLPRTRFRAESDSEFYRRKKSAVAIRHVSGDEIVALIEIVSPGNKSSRRALKAFLDKVDEFIEARIHLLIIDPFPPGPRDPQGIHGEIWEEIDGSGFLLPSDRRLTLAAYACGLTVRAFVDAVAVGDPLPDMPLFLHADRHVAVPLEATYMAAFSVQPDRWRRVLDLPA